MIFTLTSSALPPNTRVAGFHGSERLSKPYVFDIYFSVETLPGVPLVFDLADAVYAKATLTIALGNNAPWSYSGILASVRLVRAAESAVLFHAQLVPQLWQLVLTKHSRIWTKKSCIDVIKDVLDEAGIDHEFRLDAAYEVEEQITQYKESNLAFIQRWMDREGMYYYFEQVDGSDLLVITDNKSVHTSLRTSPARYWPQSDYNDIASKQAFDNFAATHNALPASVKLIDYDYARPLLDVSSTVSVETNAVGEIAEYGGRFFSPQDAQRLATIRAEEQLKNKTTFESTGAVTALSAGFKFVLEDHPLVQYNAEYLVTRIDHYGYDAQFGPAWGTLVQAKYTDVYRVELDSISADIQYRNGQLTPWPRIDGYENAIVDGPAQSIYAQIDDQGRYNVKFKFDEGSNNGGKASTFVRMAQPHGGSQEGFHFPLRKNTEVICSFLGGDPDRPVITGVVHNMLNQSVVTQNNYTQNIVRSGSLNHIVMEDTAGSMWVEMYCPIFATTLFMGHGEWNFNLTTLGRGQLQTKLDLNFDVDQWWTVDVVNYVDWHYHNTHHWVNDLAVTWLFDNLFTWTVTSDVKIDWNATLKHYVKGAATLTYDNTVGLSITGDLTEHMKSNVKTTIDGNHELLVKTHEKYTVDSGRELTISSGDKTTINGGQDLTINDHWKISTAPKTELVRGNYDLTVTGNMTSSINGNKQELTVGNKNKVTTGLDYGAHLGAKFSFQAGVFGDVTVGAKLGLTLGFLLDITAGAKLTGHFGWEHEFSPAGKSKSDPINITIVPVTINIGAPRIYIQAIELHI